MATQDFKRKLTAILSADVKGYSRLMGEDEGFTVRTITAYREVIAGVVQKHRGRVVDSPGDNLLAEFGSVVDAVRCAVEIQEELKARNAELDENRRMVFRIGINLGDVIEEEGRIYGDGVNIASRVEGLAEGGGICISTTVYDQVKNKLTLGYEYLGEHTVKNITEPISVYRVLMEPETAGKVIGKERPRLKKWRLAALSVAAALFLAGGAVAIRHFYLRPAPPSIEVASVEKMALPLPDKPSIAVLPFTNMSEDPKQDFFSDGITEEIITALSKVPDLFVIARNSTFTYKGRPVKVKRVGEELGVRYVLEGSVRKAGNRVRITAQLIDAPTEHHLWSERYDRNLKDIFAIQDEITKKIIIALQVKLTEGVQARIVGKGTDNLQAYLKYLRGRGHLRRLNKDDNVLARQMAEKAIALDSNYAAAYALLAFTHYMDVLYRSSKSPKESLVRSFELVQKAIDINDSLPITHRLLTNIYLLKRQYGNAIAEAERALALDPNSADNHAVLGRVLYYAGRPEEAIQLFKKAMRLNPMPESFYLYSLGMAYIMTGRYEEAVAACSKAIHTEPKNLFAHVVLAASYSLSGREEEARAEATEVLTIQPKFSLGYFAKTLSFKKQADLERFVNALRKAGLK